MYEMGEYPAPCEFEALNAAAISACDSNDGVVDGIITNPDTCDFKPQNLVGTSINCTDAGSMRKISSAAANIFQVTCVYMYILEIFSLASY